MDIGRRLTSLRDEKNLSQGDIEKRTGLLRCYVSRVENGHTVPAVETLEKFARALEIRLYQLMYDGQEPPSLPAHGKVKRSAEWGSTGKDARYLGKLCRSLAEMSEGDRQLLLSFAEKATKREGEPQPRIRSRNSARVSLYAPRTRSRCALRLFDRNSFTAWRTSADTGASDCLDIWIRALVCGAVSQTTVRRMPYIFLLFIFVVSGMPI